MYARSESPATSPSSGAVIRVFESADRAMAAIERLERDGFDTSKLSLIAKEEPAALHQMGLAVAGAHARVWGQRSALWNQLAETPAGMALAWVPFIGYVVAVGPAASVLVGRHWRSQPDPGASALARMLTLSGVSSSELRTFEDAVRGGQILLLVHCTGAGAARARHLLGSTIARAA